MKRCLLSLTILVMILSFCRVGLAGDTSNIKISCVIPEIPGVNVPLKEEKQNASIEEESFEDQIAGSQGVIAFQKDTIESRLVNGRIAQLEMKTIYSR